MRKYPLILVLVLISFLAKGQLNLIPGTQKLYTIAGRSLLIWTPLDTTGKRRMLCSFVGNNANDSAACVNQGPAKRIRLSTSGIHRDSFFVVTFIRAVPENGGAMALSTIDAVLTQIFNNCTFVSTTDSTRNSMTGLSQGNREVFRYLSAWGPDAISYNTLYRSRFSKEVLLSNGDDGDATGYRIGNDYRPSGTRVWYGGVAEGISPTGYFWPNDIYNFMVAINPAPRTLLDTVSGGGHSNTTWDSAWSINAPTPTKNIWRWLIAFSTSNLPPVSNAGNPQVLPLGTTTATLNGTGSVDPDGSIVSYLWQLVSGPNTPSITNPSAAITGVTGMINGSYRFRLTVTDNSAATNVDTTSVIIIADRSAITVYPGNVGQYNARNRIIPMQSFWDGDTTTGPCPQGAFSTIIDIPPQGAEGMFFMDSTYQNITMRVWNGPTAGATPLEIALFNQGMTDSLKVSKAMTVNSWNWVDTAATRGVWFPVRWIRITVKACFQHMGEMRINGKSIAKADSTFDSPATVSITPWSRFQRQVMNGDENDTLFITGGDVFNNWWYTDSTRTYTPGMTARNFINNVYGNPISHMNTYKARSWWMEARMFMGPRAWYSPLPDPPTQYGQYGDNKKYTNPIVGADSTLATSYYPEAQHAYVFARWAGRTSGTYTPHTFTLYGGGSVPVAQDYYKAMHFDNEHDFGNPERYQPVRSQVAKLSAIYDGNGNTMGSGVGVKNADPTMLVIAGPLVGIDTVAAKGFAIENYFKRGRNNMPLDGFDYNQYFVYGGAQAFFNPSPNGISPGQLGWLQYARGIVRVRDLFFPGKTVGIREFGWDKNQNTSYSALAVGSLDGETVGANYIVQAYHLGRAAKVDYMSQYRGRDEGTLADNSDFATSGQVVAQTGVRWASNYWMFAMYDICHVYNSKYPTVLLDGDSTSISMVKYDSSAADGTDTVTVVMWMSTNDDSDTTITFNAGASVIWAQKITMLKGSFEGVRNSIAPSGSNISVGTVGETPVYVRYVLGSPALNPVANAGPDQTLPFGTTSTSVNGSGSTDPDGTITGYLWELVSGPNTPTITTPTSATSTITGLTGGTYVFRLTVTDNSALTDTDDVVIIVENELPKIKGKYRWRN